MVALALRDVGWRAVHSKPSQLFFRVLRDLPVGDAWLAEHVVLDLELIGRVLREGWEEHPLFPSEVTGEAAHQRLNVGPHQIPVGRTS